MALQSTTKIRLFVSSQKEEEVLSFLQEREVLEVVPVLSELRTDVSHQAEFSVAKIDFAIRYLSPFAPEKKGLRNAVLGEKIEISSEDVSKKISGFNWEDVVSRVSALESEKNDATRELLEAKTALRALSAFKGVDTESVEGLYSSSFFVLPVKGAAAFESGVRELSPYLEINEVARTDATVSFVLFAQEKEMISATTLLSQLRGSEIAVEKGVSPAHKISGLENQIAQLEYLLDKNKEEAVRLALDLDSLKMCSDFFSSQKEVNIARRGIQSGSFVSFIEGWVETTRLESLKKEISLQFGAVEIEEIEKGEKEIERVVLDSSPVMAPIMEVTKMFGTPKIEEVDPTPYYAFFFILFFGFCLTDAGYGIILALSTWILLSLKLPFEKTMEDMIRLFFYGGLSTIVMGILFGGWLGLTPDQVPEMLTYVTDDGKRMFLGQIFDPMTDLVGKIMPLAYILGILHLSLGVFLSGLIKWKSGNKNRMLFVSLPLISSFVFASLTWVAGIAVFEYAFYASLLLSMWGLGESGNPFIRMLKGFGGLLNETLGWFSNILSYSRLFALGLATGIIAMSFNIVAITMGDMIPGILGWAVMILVLLFGHSLNIALNVLGAYVHSSRLQFVEFFGMFLEGGGKRFNPLRKVCRFRHTS